MNKTPNRPKAEKMSNTMSFIPTTNSVLVPCENDCGNDTHIDLGICGDCMADESFNGQQYQRSIVSARRNFNFS